MFFVNVVNVGRLILNGVLEPADGRVPVMAPVDERVRTTIANAPPVLVGVILNGGLRGKR